VRQKGKKRVRVGKKKKKGPLESRLAKGSAVKRDRAQVEPARLQVTARI